MDKQMTDTQTGRQIDRQTDKQTDTRPSIHIQMGKKFMPFLIPYTSLHSLH